MTAPQCPASSDEIRHSPTVLTAPEGHVKILPLPNGRFKVTLEPRDPDAYIPRTDCETPLPPDIISAFLNVSFTWLCDTLARYDDPEYVQKVLRTQLLAYFDASEFRGKRLLDFGCGAGASTMCIGAMFRETEVVGVELDQARVELARRVLSVRPLSNVQFFVSPDPKSLPAGIGSFDFVMLSAVYEHLLPDERRQVMPLIWSALKYGGALFINQTPYRYFPYEHHSTGLWFINYLPDWLSLVLARNFSRKNSVVNKSRDWAVHLRGGIRGGTEGEILRDLSRARAGRPVILQPNAQDRAAYWLSSTNAKRYGPLKKAITRLYRLTDRLWGTVPSINVDVAIRKNSE